MKAGGEGDDRGLYGWMASRPEGHELEEAPGVGDGFHEFEQAPGVGDAAWSAAILGVTKSRTQPTACTELKSIEWVHERVQEQEIH